MKSKEKHSQMASGKGKDLLVWEGSVGSEGHQLRGQKSAWHPHVGTDRRLFPNDFWDRCY